MVIEGLYNFRDTGGIPLRTGGATRPGVLYRSAALGSLTPNGLDELAETNIGVVVDFRTDQERAAAPDRLPRSRRIELVELALLQGAMSDMTKQMMPASGAPDPAVVEKALNSLPTLGDLYTGMLQQGGHQFGKVARLIAASSEDTPSAVLVHCTAGKDRTGVAMALMLEAAGAERDAVIEDYASSQDYLAGAWADGMLGQITAAGLPITPALRTLVTGTPPEAMEQALAWVDETHGGAAQYLSASGLAANDLQALQQRFVG